MQVIKCIFVCLIMIFGLGFLACASAKSKTTKTQDFSTLLEKQDIEQLIQNQAKSLLSKHFVKKLESKKIIVISEIQNSTSEHIDSFIVRFKTLIDEKFVFTNNNKESMVMDSRALRENEEYNQYTTKEKGNLLAPDYALRGRLNMTHKASGKKTTINIELTLTLTDLDSGIEVWSNAESISKLIPTSEAHKYGIGKQSPSKQITYNEWITIYNQCIVSHQKPDKSACFKLLRLGVPKSNDCNVDSCQKIGNIYGVIGRWQDAMMYYREAIDQGDSDAYSVLAYSFEIMGAFSHAIKYYKIACEQYGDYDACGNLGGLYGREEDYTSAKKYWEIACQKAGPQFKAQSCMDLGIMFYEGKSVRKDYSKSSLYYTKSCELDNALACNQLGSLYVEGQGVRKDISIAKRYFGKACDLGEQVGCSNWKTFRETTDTSTLDSRGYDYDDIHESVD